MGNTISNSSRSRSSESSQQKPNTINENKTIDEKYKIIKIQDLTPIKKANSLYRNNAQDNWKRVKCNHYSDCKCDVLCYMENCQSNIHSHPNSFFGAFAHAYNNHEDLVLSPDDVWMVICIHFSKYINENSEKMRDKFVDHDGKKMLSVTTHKELSENEWDEFFMLMIDEIKKNTKNNIVDTLQANFSTTGKVESILSTAVVMDSFKNYFEYGRCIPCCGIRNIKFMGTHDDWESVLDRTKKLGDYAMNGLFDSWGKYVRHMIMILRKFVDTFDNNVDVNFWNTVMNIKHGTLGSGSTSYVTGWILKFFGIYDKVESDEIQSYSIEFPVKLDNKLTGIKKTVSVIGGFGGVNYHDHAYRPQLSMIVYHDGVTFD